MLKKFLFESKTGNFFLVLLEKYFGLAVTEVAELKSQRWQVLQ